MPPLGLSDAPQEVIDEIIDRCSGDKRTLIACSLISRAWVYRTRKHLFSTLTLTDKTLPVWCGIVVAPPTATGSEPQSIPDGSSSCPSHWLSSHVTSLQLVPRYSRTSQRNLCAAELVRVKSHLSAFIHLESLTLTAVSFLTFDDASLEACFGSLAKTVQELKLSSCFLDQERLFALLRLFARLESFHASGNMWRYNSFSAKTDGLERERPTLRGSFTASESIDEYDGLLESLATAETEYHTITLGWNHPLTIAKFNALFAKCKDHLETLSLTAPERGTWHRDGLVLDLSPCDNLVGIQGQLAHAGFEHIIPTLKTVASPRFRKLTFIIIPPLSTETTQIWKELDEEISTLAKRVNAVAASDTLEVLFSVYSTTLRGIALRKVKKLLPRSALDARVSLRAENPARSKKPLKHRA